MEKFLTIAVGLMITGLGVSAILTRSVSIHWTDGEPQLDEPPKEVRGWPAVVIGIAAIAAGVWVIAKHLP